MNKFILCILSFHRYLLHPYCIADVVLDTEETQVNVTGVVLSNQLVKKDTVNSW